MIEWRPVPDFDGLYEISSDGQVRSLRSGRLMALNLDRGGYLSCLFSRGGGVKPVRIGIHRLVCRAWHGEPFGNKTDAAHWNGIKTDNRAVNIRWASRSENVADLVKHGNHYNARKDACIHGHEFTEWNTIRCQRDSNRWSRQCRACLYIGQGKPVPAAKSPSTSAGGRNREVVSLEAAL